MLKEHTLFGLSDKVEKSIERMRGFEALTCGEGFYLAFSGGKDSCCIKALADMAGVKYDAHYNSTTIDPPELIYFIKSNHSDVQIHKPKNTFLEMVSKRGMPMRMGRWCCELLKENGGSGRYVLTGVRWAESARRSKRKMTETCYADEKKRYLHPIIDWTDRDVWSFLKSNKIPYCSLYDEGFKRLGCLFCPMASAEAKKKELARYPKFAKAFCAAFDRLKKLRAEQGKSSCDRWDTGEEMFNWWISNKSSKQNSTNSRLFDN